MQVLLHTNGYPNGSCLLLAKELSRSTALSGGDSIRLAERLFDNQFNKAAPVMIEVTDSIAAESVIQICEEMGITAIRATQR